MNRLRKLAKKKSSKARSPPSVTETIPGLESYFVPTPRNLPQSEPSIEPPSQPVAHLPPPQYGSRPIAESSRAYPRPPIYPQHGPTIDIQGTLFPQSGYDDDGDDGDDDVDEDDIPAPSAREQSLPDQGQTHGAEEPISGSGGSGSGSGSGGGRKRTRGPNQTFQTPQNSDSRILLTCLQNRYFQDF